MRSVEANTNVPATKGSAQLNHHKQDELKEVRDGAAFDGQGLSEEDESRIHEDVNGGKRLELVQSWDALQRQHQQPQAPVVQWERFLPLRSLKVLLVENDDSTRHVVSALLRNCSYEVTAVANGLEAWKVLIDLNKQIDLILTEVVMPYLSGVGLLSKIMSHMPRKNIPVIMMSSDDSMGIVFNCLSKGAVDFLVKPIRKNELKNLWQHVWRKCHSSSGSGSESGIRSHKSIKARSIEESDDGNDSDEDDDISISLTAKNGSDNGSGTQSSWSKRAVEVNSSQAKSLWNQFSGLADSTCAQVIRARPETSNNHWPATTTTREHGKGDNKLDNSAMGKDLEIGVPRSSSLKIEEANRKEQEKIFESNSKKMGDKLDTKILVLGCENGELRTDSPNVTVAITKRSNSNREAVAETNDLLKNIDVEQKTIYNNEESPALELSLTRPKDMEDAETSTHERNVVRQSNLSAFSRYKTTSNANQAPTGNVGSCSPPDNNSSEAAKPENIQFNSNASPNQRSNNTNNDDMGSTTNNAFPKPEALADDKAIAVQPLLPSSIDNDTVQVRHHHHHYHHHHHHVHKVQQQEAPNHNDGSLRNMVSNVLTASSEGNAANYGSASGSNNNGNGENGSSGQKGSSFAAMAEGDKMGSDNGVAEKCEGGDGSGSGSGRGSGVNQDRLAQREAALNKFRQKRKERCFEKKVRYQSRKRLAEQRPRVRGQFVRQGANSNKNEDADS